MIQLGDFGVIWPGENWQVALRDLSRALTRNGQTLHFVDGNHDYHPRLFGYPIDENGYRWVSWNVAHLPRGFRTRIGENRVLTALGGANSTDRDLRLENVDWWAAELTGSSSRANESWKQLEAEPKPEPSLSLVSEDGGLEIKRKSRPLTPRKEATARRAPVPVRARVRRRHPRPRDASRHPSRWPTQSEVTVSREPSEAPKILRACSLGLATINSPVRASLANDSVEGNQLSSSW